MIEMGAEQAGTRTKIHSHTQTHKYTFGTRATDGRGPDMLPELEPGPVGKPPWLDWGSIDI